MAIILAILIVALIAKDTSYLNDPYLMRGIAQALCLIMGLVWLLLNLKVTLIKRYWVFWGYIFALTISAITSDEAIYVLFQVASITSVILFAISFFESRRSNLKEAIKVPVNATSCIYTLVMIISLSFVFLAPALAYQNLHSGNWSVETRFRGLFSQAGMMGSASGLLIGLSYFGLKSRWLKVLPVISGSICIVLTQSRTFWGAAIIAGSMTLWRYYPGRRKIALVLTAVGLVMFFIIYLSDITPDIRSTSKFVRTDSLASLSGRTEIWQKCSKAFANSPLVGYGFTVGYLGLEDSKSKSDNNSSFSPRDIGRRTLHSGYIQSLLDVGIFGTIFYISAIILSIIKIYRSDRHREFPMMYYSLIFLVVANFSEDVIYSASVYQSVFFWIVAVFAFSLRMDDNMENLSKFRIVNTDSNYA